MKIVKFLTSSAMATVVDFVLYNVLILSLIPAVANMISASVGMVINFVIQRRWVFTPTRGVRASFVLSLLFSLGGVALGTLLIYMLTTWTFLSNYPVIAKVVAIGIVFFYNYETKKIAFGDR